MNERVDMKPYTTPAERTWYWVQIAAAVIPFLALIGMVALIGAGVIWAR